jgi:hypothetical protein
MISLTCHWILSVRYSRIRRILSEYSLRVGNGQPDMPSDIICVVLLDQADTVLILSRCREWSAWHAFGYYLWGTVGSGGYCPNIHSVQGMISLTCLWILSVRYSRIRRILSKYSVGVGNDQPDMPLNIICEVQSDQADTVRIFTTCRQWSAWHAIGYYLCGTVGSGGYCLNIQSV